MEFVRFGELYSIPSGNGLSRPSAVRGEGYRMIGMGELFAKDIISDMEMDRVQMSEREKKTFLVESGDLLFARQSLVAEGAGKCSIVKDLSEPTTFESHLIRVRLNKQKCNPWYFFYLFRLPDNPIKAIVNQCAQAGIRGNELLKIKVPLPERKIQDRIANVLSDYDNLIEVNNKRIKVLEQMAENLYKEWFVRFRYPGHENATFENGIPKGWTRDCISECYITSSGGTPSRDNNENYNGGTIPWIKTGELQDSLLLDTEEKITEAAINSSSAKIFPKDSVLMAMYGVNIGMLAYSTMDATCNQACCVFKDKGNVNTKHYLFQFLKSIRDYLLIIGFGAAQQNLSQDLIKRIKIVMPDKETLIRFEQKIDLMYDETKLLLKANTLLVRQRDMLLPRLMSGKLEIKA